MSEQQHETASAARRSAKRRPPVGRLGWGNDQRPLRERIRSPRFWVLIVALLIANWVAVSLLL